jgi:hypothetical protein
VKFGPQHVHDDIITFEQSKNRGREEGPVVIPLLPEFCKAPEEMPPSKVVRLIPATTFLIGSAGAATKLACQRAL